MDQVILHIENPSERQDYELGQEVTIGRTDASALVLSDSGLSRRNTTIFRDGEAVLVVDESSLNGTILNGAKISGPPQELRDGDILRIGSETTIRIAIRTAAGRPEIQRSVPTSRPNIAPMPAAVSQLPAGEISGPRRL